ncbi:TIGR04086 family membrane protein [Chondrinema litorale]|uniref:TIGR04086 family membrane protein n=1 Tax=Chondrinema litorale TaxID=2994555 RepID=UPI0025426EBF|nr:TIGR04086 family membrane protein [Chondrinema litorale]UZR93310.1 TIGR04086 family membrane protein [Chondrinema litorale]
MPDYNKFSASDENSIFDRDAWGVNTIGVILTTLIVAVLFGIFFKTGLGEFADGFMGLVIALFSLIIGAFISYLLLNITYKFPKFYWVTFGAVFFTLLVLLISRNDLVLDILFFLTLLFILMQGFFVGLVWAFISGRLRFIKHNKRLIARLLFFLIILIDIGAYYLLGGISIEDQQTFKPNLEKLQQAKIKAGLAQDNEFRVKAFYYGSGEDINRSTYKEGVAFKSESFDLSAWLPTEQKYFNSIYEWFWGFNAKNIPINANVWMPESDTLQHPLVFVVHGQENIAKGAEDGFNYLSERLAGLGYIAVSVDLNFFNFFWLKMPQHERIKAKSIVILKHLEAYKKWNAESGHDLYNKIDTTAAITLIGHGEGSLVSWQLAKYNRINRLPSNANKEVDTNFTIGNIIAFSPQHFSDFSNSKLKDINYLSVSGGYNTLDEKNRDVQFQNVEFIDTLNYHFKDDIYVHKGNYSHFNESLDGRDNRPPFNWLINQAAVMSGKNQREFTSKLVEAFMNLVYTQTNFYKPVFQNTYNLLGEDAKGVYYNQFEDNSYISLTNFDEDENPLTGTSESISISSNNLKVWEEIPLSAELGSGTNKGVVIAWNSESWQSLGSTVKKDSTSAYELNIQSETENILSNLDNHSIFTFSLIHMSENASPEHDLGNSANISSDFDFSIEFVDTIGVINKISFKNIGKAAVPMQKTAYKIAWLDKNPVNLHYQTYFFPVFDFLKLNPEFDLKSIGKIRFVFDKTLKGKILLDNIGFNINRNFQKLDNDGSLDTEG